MSISINNPGIPRPIGTTIRDGTRTREPQAPFRNPVPATQPGKQQPSAAPSVPVEPPPGTDPALWSVLSGEERAFFAKAGAMGPLTYGRAMQEMQNPQLPASRGGRLDVRI
jgi:hypothetical protein